MSLGSISVSNRMSDAQFVGDLFGLFKRHRIAAGEPDSYAQFESQLASKDSFRSQLFTLCTAISHMADADLSGEQLFDLIGRALGGGGAKGSVPEKAKEAFLAGYEGWCNRVIEETDTWPPVRGTSAGNAPIPFPLPAEGFAGADELNSATEVRAPGMRTVQEALLMAKKESPFQLSPRTVSAPGAGGNGVSVEGLTISELTKLLEDIEHRMSKIRPQVNQLSGIVLPNPESLERLPKNEVEERLARLEHLRPSLVTTTAVLPPIDGALLVSESTTVDQAKEEKFLARHSYLKPERRLPPGRRQVEMSLEIKPVETLAPVAASVPVGIAEVGPVGTALAAILPPVLESVESVARPSYLPEVPAVIDHSNRFPIAVAYKSEKFRLYFHIAVGVFAAFVLVGCPLAGIVLIRSLHPVSRYVYQDVRPEIQSSTTAATPSTSPPSSAAATVTGTGVTGPQGPAAVHSTTTHAAGGKRAERRKPPPVAVWPPPPSKQAQ